MVSMTVFEQILSGGLFVAVLGSYVYIYRVYNKMRDKHQETKDGVKKALKGTQEALTDLTLTVSVRLTAIETQLGIQLPSKGGPHED